MAVDYKELKKGGFMRQRQKDHFSMRLKSVGGHFTAAQLGTVQKVAEQYGKGYVHLTSRQGIEIPFIRLEDIDEVKKTLHEGGVSVGVCGPRVRTITACQGCAVCASGLIDTQRLANEFDKRYGGRELPHKFKFGFTGCHNNCLKAEENDFGVKGGVKPAWSADNWQGRAGFVISFGGLYGNRIAIGRHFLPIVFEEEKLYEVVDTTLAFFEKYAKPSERFANCLGRVGWDKFEQEVEKIL